MDTPDGLTVFAHGVVIRIDQAERQHGPCARSTIRSCWMTAARYERCAALASSSPHCHRPCTTRRNGRRRDADLGGRAWRNRSIRPDRHLALALGVGPLIPSIPNGRRASPVPEPSALRPGRRPSALPRVVLLSSTIAAREARMRAHPPGLSPLDQCRWGFVDIRNLLIFNGLLPFGSLRYIL
ncbi:hypothetical protein ACVWXP_006449 [Bradyrhizobium sp. USDA 4463]